MKYRCKPIEVTAYEIVEIPKSIIERSPNGKREIAVKLDNGDVREVFDYMTSRMLPEIGDYWVEAPNPDGSIYHYLNPKAVFESKYEAINV